MQVSMKHLLDLQNITTKLHFPMLEKDTQRKLMFGGGAVVIVIGIIAAVTFAQRSSVDNFDKSADPSRGPENAVVVIKEYSDFECPACAGAAPVVKSVLAKYDGQVRFEYNDFPLPQHNFAVDAAIGAQCADEQGKFWAYHDRLFETQPQWAALTDDTAVQDIFRGYASELQMNMDAFESCVTNKATADRVNEDIAEGRGLGVNSTPTFFVNGEKVTETPFAAGLTNAIEAALAGEGE